ncbi:hypothetical protein LEM8419_01843 [Neolewinella maritima]|uniref:UspA domain-containing protein n=1 Tax=Neolewinella maritima TaxID=1383882 RepID=A0ABM9B0W5_9BACT|nr:universal stress protein [Neolewinella maritima]CAH1000709.1 hypothetical protein LEM8419_01843 [Neolewinella maritima]
MRHLLVPTDFSQAADNALEYARLLATEFDAALTLAYIHAMPMDPMRIGEISSELYQDGEAAIEERASRLREGGLVVHTDVQLGMPASRLKRIVFKQGIDLVVMGCQGEHYMPEQIFGSTTTELMDEVTVPIIAVPATYTPAFPRHLMWAADRRAPQRAATLYPLFELVDHATTELKVFHYQEKKESTLPSARFKELLAEVRYDYFYQLADGETPEGAIREFVRMTDVDLVALIHRQSTWLSRMMMPSCTRKSVYTSPVPVLILQEAQAL